MKPRLSVVTIGADHLERSLAVYRDGLGLPTRGIFGAEYEHGAVAFFDLQQGFTISGAAVAEITKLKRAPERTSSSTASGPTHACCSSTACSTSRGCGYIR